MRMKRLFPVIVDYSKPLIEMIGDGNYAAVNPDILESHFSIHGQSNVVIIIELVYYHKMMKSEDIIQDIESCSLRPATLPELLAFGTAYPEKQCKYPIVAMGSVWKRKDGSCYVTCLDNLGCERGVGLDVWEGKWSGDYRFATVRKK